MAFIEPMHLNKPNITYLLTCIHMPFTGMACAYAFSTYSINSCICTNNNTNPITVFYPLLYPCIFIYYTLFFAFFFVLGLPCTTALGGVNGACTATMAGSSSSSRPPAGGPPAAPSPLVASSEVPSKKSKSSGTASQNVRVVLEPGVGWGSSTLRPVVDWGCGASLLALGPGQQHVCQVRQVLEFYWYQQRVGQPLITCCCCCCCCCGWVDGAEGLTALTVAAVALATVASRLSANHRSKAVWCLLRTTVAAIR